MTDLLQSAVLSGTGRAAQIGRPVAGKTGTTTSNKDGWFIGFSSGLTTGVWMGRDDAKPVGGLQGGTAPARAFHDFMTVAVARRPVEQFQTQVPMPDWQLTPEEEIYGDQEVDVNQIGPMMVDENGMPIGTPPERPGLSAAAADGPARWYGHADQQELDQAFPPQQQQPQVRRPPPGYPPQPQPQPRPDQPQPQPSRPRPIRLSRGPMRRSAAFALARPGPNSRASSALKSRPVVEVHQMRDLVRGDVTAHLGRREDQPPAHPDPTFATSSCPSALPRRRS